MGKIGLFILLLTFSFYHLLYGQPIGYWEQKERTAKVEARRKLLLKDDICNVCNKVGKSKQMYRAIEYGKSFYAGEFVRIHKNCIIAKYMIIENPQGEKGISWDEMFSNQLRIERLEIARLFPFLDILDELIDFTSGVVFYSVKNSKTGKTYEIYNWEGSWKTREKLHNGKYLFGEKK